MDISSFPLEMTFKNCCCQIEVTAANMRGRGYSPERATLPSRHRLCTQSSQERQWMGGGSVPASSFSVLNKMKTNLQL